MDRGGCIGNTVLQIIATISRNSKKPQEMLELDYGRTEILNLLGNGEQNIVTKIVTLLPWLHLPVLAPAVDLQSFIMETEEVTSFTDPPAEIIIVKIVL